MSVYQYISTFPRSHILTFLCSELLITYYLYNSAYPLFYSFTSSISPASCTLILNQYKSPLSTCTILFIRSVTYLFKYIFIITLKEDNILVKLYFNQSVSLINSRQDSSFVLILYSIYKIKFRTHIIEIYNIFIAIISWFFKVNYIKY